MSILGTGTSSPLPYVIAPLREVKSDQPIHSHADLVNHLHQAAQLEMSTIPMYLYAAYSIETKGHSQWDPGISASRTIISIVLEEMLHLALVRNLMLAIGAGDQISFYDREFMPHYPSLMLHRAPDLELHLEPCTTSLMDRVFMPLELPAEHGAPPQPDRYNTIGQFYECIEDGFRYLTENDPQFWSQAPDSTKYQYTAAYWNRDGGGEPVVVHDLKSAMTAMSIIVEQGEGVDPDKATVPIDPINPKPGLDELSHYAKFQRIRDGIEVIGVVKPVPVNPKVADFEGAAVALADLFNAAYAYTLCMLDKLYTLPRELAPERPSPRYHLERTFIAAMGGLLYPIADILTRTPIGDMDGQPINAAPTFEYYDFVAGQKRSGSKTKKEHVMWLCNQAIADFPELGGDNSVHWLLAKMPDIETAST
ncbi:MAG: ferritin-like domain-containing protein [Pseudonocardiaceae bacterium]